MSAMALFALGCAPASPRLTAYGVALGDTNQQVAKLLGKPSEVKLGCEHFPGMTVEYKEGRVVRLETDQLELDGVVLKGSKAIRDGLLQSQPERRGPGPTEIYLDTATDTQVVGYEKDPRIELGRIPPPGPVDRKGVMDPPGGTLLPD